MGVYKDYILFEREILSETWGKTKEFVKKNLLGESLFMLCGIVAMFLLNPFDHFGELESLFILAAATVFIMFVGIFLSCLVTAPFRIWRKQSKEIVGLHVQLDEKKYSGEILLSLQSLVKQGSTLGIKEIRENELQDWKKGVQDFRDGALDLIERHVSHTEALNFTFIKTTIKVKYSHAVNEEHNRAITVLGVQVDKLMDITKKYEEKS